MNPPNTYRLKRFQPVPNPTPRISEVAGGTYADRGRGRTATMKLKTYTRTSDGVNIDRNPNGSLTVYATNLRGTHLFRRTYHGYTRAEAIANYRADRRAEHKAGNR